MPKKIQGTDYYSKIELSKRGWSPEMMVTLLPNGQRRKKLTFSGGRKVMLFYWPVETVLAAEETDEFARMRSRAAEKRRLKAERRAAVNEFRRQVRELSVDANPQDAYPEARKLSRHFVLHIGPTNSGKTYDALQRLKTAERGIYLGPLRLLALEVYDRMTQEGIPCNMVTGEESLCVPDARITACTIEILDTERLYDVAVIDEAQMIGDAFRGWNWTRALLGVCAREVHVCLAPEAEDIVKAVIDECEDDDWEVVYHERKTPLVYVKGPLSLDHIGRGDALVVFSRRAVLSLVGTLLHYGIKASAIYGDLPPAARREQVHKFMSGETDVVVSTDAIGMGLNLAIKRMIFVETCKYDGKEMRLLSPAEVKQIAGRAGRYGLYPRGEVLALENGGHIAGALKEPAEPVNVAFLGFPERLLTLDRELMTLMQEWKKAPTEKFYVKMELTELECLHDYLQREFPDVFARLSKQDLYSLLTCSVNTKNADMMAQWAAYCREYVQGVRTFSLPEICGDASADLEKMETEYHCLDLYFQISHKMRLPADEEYLRERKTVLEGWIDNKLAGYKDRSSKRCRFCGRRLYRNAGGNVCDVCRRRWNI